MCMLLHVIICNNVMMLCVFFKKCFFCALRCVCCARRTQVFLVLRKKTTRLGIEIQSINNFLRSSRFICWIDQACFHCVFLITHPAVSHAAVCHRRYQDRAALAYIYALQNFQTMLGNSAWRLWHSRAGSGLGEITACRYWEEAGQRGTGEAQTEPCGAPR